MILTKGMESLVPVTLSEASEQSEYRIDRVGGPEQRRLCELGLIEGQAVTVVNRARRGMMVVKVGASRLALARGMADYVWVK